MKQKNTRSGKTRDIRPPFKGGASKPPPAPIVPPGPTTVVKVKKGQAGTTIQVPHPQAKGQFISVNVPADAKPGQAMLVPVPPAKPAGSSGGGGSGMSTGGKVAL